MAAVERKVQRDASDGKVFRDNDGKVVADSASNESCCCGCVVINTAALPSEVAIDGFGPGYFSPDPTIFNGTFPKATTIPSTGAQECYIVPGNSPGSKAAQIIHYHPSVGNQLGHCWRVTIYVDDNSGNALWDGIKVADGATPLGEYTHHIFPTIDSRPTITIV